MLQNVNNWYIDTDHVLFHCIILLTFGVDLKFVRMGVREEK